MLSPDSKVSKREPRFEQHKAVPTLDLNIEDLASNNNNAVSQDTVLDFSSNNLYAAYANTKPFEIDELSHPPIIHHHILSTSINRWHINSYAKIISIDEYISSN